MRIKRINRHFTGLLILSGLFAVVFSAVGLVTAFADVDECDRDCRRQLAAARAATAKYHNIQEAINDGFVPVSPCVEVPGLGAMGIHYMNFSRAMNPNAAADEPEVLLYMPDKHGRLRLVALEYVVPTALSPTAPTLFGRQYHFDEPRDQWALHVWIWRNNPSGMFEDFNPAIGCPQQ